MWDTDVIIKFLQNFCEDIPQKSYVILDKGTRELIYNISHYDYLRVTTPIIIGVDSDGMDIIKRNIHNNELDHYIMSDAPLSIRIKIHWLIIEVVECNLDDIFIDVVDGISVADISKYPITKRLKKCRKKSDYSKYWNVYQNSEYKDVWTFDKFVRVMKLYSKLKM